MSEEFSVKKTVILHAPAYDVWRALIDPRLIKEYFFAVYVSGDWKEGNTIAYKGEWQGKKYESKAKVLQMEDQRLLRYSYWSNMSGLPDIPQHYHIITYFLQKEEENTVLTMTEENLAGQEMMQRSSRLWDEVFEKLQNLLEKEKFAPAQRR
jgi:uncharacterized protein YndB with AHSA1/START domain